MSYIPQFLQSGANAITQKVETKLREGFVVTPEDFGADGTPSNDSQAVQRALNAIQTNGNGTLHLKRFYQITGTPLAITNTAISIRGEGCNRSGLIDVGVTAAQWVLTINNTDYTDGVSLRDFSLLTTKTTPDSYALYVSFSQTDATYNRAPIRFVMENIDIRGRDVDGTGFMTQGFVRGVTLVNVIRPIVSNVNIAGKQTSFSASGMSSLVEAWTLTQSGPTTVAPTDASFSQCQVYCANHAWSISGHWEGVLFDRCLSVGTNTGIEWFTENTYPWLSVQNSHFNCFQNIITTVGVFDVKIMNNLFYKWWFTGATGLVDSTAITINPGFRSTIIGNTFYNNPADASQTVIFNAIDLHNTGSAVISDNVFDMITYGLTLNGASDNCLYVRGTATRTPGFGPTPAEYRNFGSGVNNKTVFSPLQAYINGFLRWDINSSNNVSWQSLIPGQDNSYNLGGGSNRWANIYGATGAINTSDGREKQDISALTQAEKNVARKLLGSIRRFRFKDAVDQKQEAARKHIGLIAQDVQEAFESEGLDGFEYGMLCNDDGRLGLRYEEVITFILGYLADVANTH